MIDFRSYLIPIFLLLAQTLFAFLLGFHSEYKYTAIGNFSDYENPPRGILEFYYPFFMDVHVMMFVGFGFLMTFLRRYSFSSVGFNFILCAFTLEWTVICQGYIFDWSSATQKFFVDTYSLIGADFTSAAVLISMGAVLGKVNGFQLLIMAFLEVPLQVVNKYICSKLFCASDAGESMYVHTFGAYFGLAAALVLYRSNVSDSKNEKSRYTSDLLAMIGTVFLFCFWPSFNSAAAVGVDRIRAVVNTYVSISASVVGAFMMSSLLKKGKLDMVHVQNSTLAGGVAVGTVAGSNIGLHGALVIGSLAGMLSVLGYNFVLPLSKKILIHDTCGVHYLHGLPGVLSAITGIIVSSIGDRSGFLVSLKSECLGSGKGRNGSEQSGFQAAALGLTFGLAVVGGLFTGLIMRIPVYSQKENDFDDEMNWHLPDADDDDHSIAHQNHLPVKAEHPTSF